MVLHKLKENHTFCLLLSAIEWLQYGQKTNEQKICRKEVNAND